MQSLFCPATGILGIGTRAILSRMQKQDSRQKALEYGVQALLRDRMLHCYNKYIDAGFAPIYAKRKLRKYVPAVSRTWRQRCDDTLARGIHGTANRERRNRMKRDWKQWTKAAVIRAIKTIAQTAIATVGVAATMQDVNWLVVGSTALLAGLLSVLTSVAGLPEIKE